ncbi:putative 3-deoxy-manno-octulosonate cytidylyltransferase [Helianthus annuus]|uniref:3-deoxy-manno-octulosonate cytidylyltransferase n=1 Tax=Helianthus annuus TaxID=4232 RepID=A0A9K3P1G8_HELAN|nr:putative 3-deoxy-manno-octulosonate cytidylyltransferase [Helianthus annuus]
MSHFVPADDGKFAECCCGFGADMIMTAESCRNSVRLYYLIHLVYMSTTLIYGQIVTR